MFVYFFGNRFFPSCSFRTILSVPSLAERRQTDRAPPTNEEGIDYPSTKMSLNHPSFRRATFHKTRRGVLKALNWPHPLIPKSLSIHADKLSLAGFIHIPTLESPDLTRCFLCALEVDGWAVGDDPWERHRVGNRDCAMIKLEHVEWTEWRDQADWDWGVDGVDWPRSEEMDRARLETFSIGWPHEGSLGIPTKEEVRPPPLSVSFFQVKVD